MVLVAALLGAVPATARTSSDGAAVAQDAYTVTPAVSPVVQSGPRNIVKRVQDTYVSSTDARDHSAGSVLHIGSPDNGTTRYRSYVQFDVARLKGVAIKSAALRLYNSYTGSCDGWWMYADPVAAAWNEKTVTWATRPAVTAGYQASANFGVGSAGCADEARPFDPATSNGIHRLDVTAMVRAWTSSTGALPNYGIQLSAGELDSKAYKDFCSMNPSASVYACDAAYNAPTLEIEFDDTSSVVSAGNSKPVANGGYPADVPAIEFFRSGKVADGPYQRWLPDAYHSVADPAGKLFPTRAWGGGTDHRLRPAGAYAEGDPAKKVMVVTDGNSGFVGVIPYPSLSGYKWAYNVGDAGVSNVHGAELLPDGNVAVASSKTGTVAVYARATGDPTSPTPGPAKPLSSKPLEAAHQVLYDPSTSSLWAIGGHALVRYTYDPATGTLDDGEPFALPQQISSGGLAAAWGHDLEPVYGDPDRLWVAANAGIVQFSKSGSAGCYKGSLRWPLPQQVSGGGMENHWCTDYLAEKELNVQPLVKSIGNDPVSGERLTTCADGCEGSNTNPSYTTSWLRFVTTGGHTDLTRWWNQSQHYRARWMVPSYQ
ncbi:hypothetical protein GCM10010394_23720 [Streptomyces crystallinus]|uniref:Carbohydrate-binding module family 96 domain-containing protein n=1 Tax=Streptomyces crystallinus TaxID=68191 RepID=A0ABN1FLZ9_9ACTN